MRTPPISGFRQKIFRQNRLDAWDAIPGSNREGFAGVIISGLDRIAEHVSGSGYRPASTTQEQLPKLISPHAALETNTMDRRNQYSGRFDPAGISMGDASRPEVFHSAAEF